MAIQRHCIELCFTCHPQYGLLSDPVTAFGIEGATLHGREDSKEGMFHYRKPQQQHLARFSPSEFRFILQIQMIISVEIRTSSRCVIDIQKALGLTLIQKTKFH